MTIQKKALHHVSDTLKSIDIHSVYKVLRDVLGGLEIDKDIRFKIEDACLESIMEENKKVDIAKEWIDVLLSNVE